MATPYDGKVGFWHWEGGAVGESTIDDLATNLKKKCPTADAIWIKTSDGDSWQGNFDNKASMEINDPHDINRWVDTLALHGLELHCWAVVRGKNIPGEAAKIIDACKVAGVKSMVLDVEPHEGFWNGDKNDVIRLMSTIRQGVGSSFHIGMSVDPRAGHYARIVPEAWRPYINSIHPQVYWDLMQRDPDDVLDETYVVWGNYGLPIFPVFETYAESGTLRKAQDLARSVRGATGISYFRLGVGTTMQYSAINDEFVAQEVGPDNILRRYGWTKIVSPDDSGFRNGSHTGADIDQVFKSFTSVRGHQIKYKNTEVSRDTVWAQWRPRLPKTATYEVSIYAPGRHATSHKAKYHIHGITGAGTELLVQMNQSKYSNQWVPLVVYEFEDSKTGGNVNLSDLTGESGREIAFTAVRWREVLEQTPQGDTGSGTGDTTDGGSTDDISTAGFDPPVGTADERLTSKVWPGRWYDATGYATFYTTVGGAYHTGADLNLPADADRNDPIYAITGGTVTFRGRSSGSWGTLIIIRHDPLPDGTVVWSRTAHIRNALVSEGDRVERGQQIAEVGNADGMLAWHLHFDIAKTNILESRPGHWPGANLSLVLKHYVDPRKFIEENRPPGRG